MSEQRRDYLLFFEDIITALKKIEAYTAGITFDFFLENNMAVDAVIRNFEVIGEATKKIPLQIKQKYPEVEWKEASGFRDVLIHDYFGIDVEAVWETIQNNIPLFKRHIEDAFHAESQARKTP
jgi:uncharacterized protein with HEPN domain